MRAERHAMEEEKKQLILELSNADMARYIKVERVQFVCNGDIRVWVAGNDDPYFLQADEDGGIFYDDQSYTDAFVEFMCPTEATFEELNERYTI